MRINEKQKQEFIAENKKAYFKANGMSEEAIKAFNDKDTAAQFYKIRKFVDERNAKTPSMTNIIKTMRQLLEMIQKNMSYTSKPNPNSTFQEDITEVEYRELRELVKMLRDTMADFVGMKKEQKDEYVNSRIEELKTMLAE